MTDIETFLNYQAPEQALQGRVIVVTGAGDGIGKCAAQTFAQYGATVVLLGRTISKLEAVYDAIEAAGHPQPAIFPIHFESAIEQDYQQLKTALTEEFGCVDGLLHNAGELGPMTPITNYSLNDWQKLMQVNATAPFLLTQALLPLLQKSRDGRIVYTGSSVGVRGRAYWGGYSASKAAVENLMEVVADELEQSSIRVNSINPGATRTRMRAAAYPAERPESVPTPETIMNRYLFLFGPDSHNWHGLRLDAQPK